MDASGEGGAVRHLDELESQSVFLLREAYANCRRLAMLWSMGKDSTVLLWLVRKAFFGHVPFPLVHIDTTYKIPEMIVYRDRMVREWRLDMILGINQEALAARTTYPNGAVDRLTCCRLLKTQALEMVLRQGSQRLRFDHGRDEYVPDPAAETFTGLILGIRADEEGSRSKERYFSLRDRNNEWNVAAQPPEFWDQFNTEFPPGAHVRVHPLLDWTELDIWRYIDRERIPTVSLYYDHGDGLRYRSLGCHPCTFRVESRAATVSDIIAELSTGRFRRVAERTGRAQDLDDEGGLETLRREGYM
jgi:sulfate adenylyltransferase subunit 2